MVLREATITSDKCLYREMTHEYLQQSLGFPDYYGRNFSALADCLSEAGEPLLITVNIDPDTLPTDMQAFVMKLVQVIARESLVNENVSLIIEHTV